eukprot:GGOE01021516.1.p1 GENE.GGOE01021516.1~~GGOE01021516.1.p1  ORF type:complete len:206 (+),score=40.50 GGOE01021516.1:543-1160(+)
MPFKGPAPDSLDANQSNILSLPVPPVATPRQKRRHSVDSANPPNAGVRHISPLRMHVDAIRDRYETSKFVTLFPDLAQETPSAVHRCEVVHLGRPCGGTLFITPAHFCYSGSKGLQESIALHDIRSIRYHRDADHMTFELLPVDAFPQDATGLSIYTDNTLYRFHRFRHGASQAMEHLLAAWKQGSVSPSHVSTALRQRRSSTIT